MHKKLLFAGAVTITCLICACSFFSNSIQGATRNIFSRASSSTFTFTDSNGTTYTAPLNKKVDLSPYDADKFVMNGDLASYEDKTYTSRLGVDVSYYQGDIDWKKVKAAGYDFAFIRIGYRGYGSEGSLNADERFAENIKGAQEAGLDTGVYFFSQAVSEDEAREEAQFVVNTLNHYNISLQLPVVYDPEKVFENGSRTLTLEDEQFTTDSVIFCTELRKSGYEPAVYVSMLWEAYTIDLSRLSGIPIWYADYVDKPQTPYNFKWWQYSNNSKVDGIPIQCDVDIEIYRK